MSTTNEEITFAQIFGLIKKSFKRAIIYLLSSVIILTSLLFVIREFTSFTTSKSVVMVSEESKITLTDINYNKATAVQKAIADVYGENGNEGLASSALGALSINAVVPANLDDEQVSEFVPTTFTLTISNKNIPELSEEELNSLLDKISTELLSSLSLSELPKLEITDNLATDLEVLEYFQITEELYSQAENVYNIISNQIYSKDNSKEYTDPESGYSLNDILGKVNSILAKTDNLKTYIISNRIENINGLEEMLNTKKTQAKVEHDAYEATAKLALEVLNKFPSASTSGTSTTQSSNGTYVLDSAAYENLAREYYAIINNQGEAKREMDKYDKYITTISALSPNADPQKSEYVEKTLADIFADLKTTLSEYKVLAKEYNENHYSTVETKIVAPAHSAKQNSISVVTIVLANVCVAFIAYLVAVFQVKAKSEKVMDNSLIVYTE